MRLGLVKFSTSNSKECAPKILGTLLSSLARNFVNENVRVKCIINFTALAELKENLKVDVPCNRNSLDVVRLKTHTLNPLSAIFKARFLPITARPITPMSALYVYTHS